MENIISQRDALDLIYDPTVTFIDGSWYLPAQKRDGRAEFAANRIPGATYFDIDKISDQDTDLPHMLPSAEQFRSMVEELGISSEDLNIVYDGPGLFSAPRVWWTLKVMGAKQVKILEGGFDSWKSNDLPIEQGPLEVRTRKEFTPNFQADRVADIGSVIANLESKQATVIDARPVDRYNGTGTEPRPGLRNGHIPGSKSAPSSKFVHNGKLADHNTLERIFRDLDIGRDTEVITTCGSGVTAAILALALAETGRDSFRLFDGSWAEWGKPDGPAIKTNG